MSRKVTQPQNNAAKQIGSSGYFTLLVSSETECRPPNEDRIRGIAQ